jgi:hypothetical protein
MISVQQIVGLINFISVQQLEALKWDIFPIQRSQIVTLKILTQNEVVIGVENTFP